MGELKNPYDAEVERFGRVCAEYLRKYMTLKKPYPPKWDITKEINYKGFSFFSPRYMWLVNTYGSKNAEMWFANTYGSKNVE